MVDFKKLKAQKKQIVQVDPIEIFRRLPKPSGINDLYTSQAEVLAAWYKRRGERDTVIKLHTGGGKTLVGLLMAQSALNESGEPVLYLVPNVQLLKQTIDKANEFGIPVVPYEKGQSLNNDFTCGKAIMVATYSALFNGKSKFGLRGSSSFQMVSTIILDDAHAAFSVVRNSFSLNVSSSKDHDLYEWLSSLFRESFSKTDKLGTFDDVVSGAENAVLEVPYWAFFQQLDAVREAIKHSNEDYSLVWPLLRDKLQFCHALISKNNFTITPILPFVDAFPTFFDAQRRIYMSATIADDSDIIRTFDASKEAVGTALASRSLAGISERMILTPELMPFSFDGKQAIDNLAKQVFENGGASVILTSSDRAALAWDDIAKVAKGSTEAEAHIAALQEGRELGPVVFANRYDGIDLPGDSCRLLIMSGLPTGTSDYELYKSSALLGGASVTKQIAQKIEQGIGRGARGAGDHCVVVMMGSTLSSWISKKTNFQLFTSATKAQLEMGEIVSKEVENMGGLLSLAQQSYSRDKYWTEYHAETLAELVDEDEASESNLSQASIERKAISLWQDGCHEKAISKIETFLDREDDIDGQTEGWLEQFVARIAYQWGSGDLAESWQRKAYRNNRNLVRPLVLPPYRPLKLVDDQAVAIVQGVELFKNKRGFMQSFETCVSFLHENSSANQFEQALCDLAKMIGLAAERRDDNGEGPDVFWLLPDKTGLVIEAKSRKKGSNAFRKDEHGQLLVAAEWFGKHYPEYSTVRVSVHPENQATKAASAWATHVLTYEKLGALVSDSRALLARVCESQLDEQSLAIECNRYLEKSNISFDCLIDNYLSLFEEVS